MAEILFIEPERFKTSQWSGGVTTELFIRPEGASYAERRFDFRISTALVELERSEFTHLPGVKRFLTPLGEHGFTLVINGAESVKLNKGGVLCFDGADEVTCFGSGRDLNLMLKGKDGDMRFVEAGASVWVGKAEYVFVYAVDNAFVSLCDGQGSCSMALGAGGFARLAGSGCLNASGRLVLFTIY